MRILSIESSCDETATALVEFQQNKIKVLSHIVGSQIKIHKKYGGVVPEVAARNHCLRILEVVDKTLKMSDLFHRPVPMIPDIDAIAVTNRPGLMGSLMVGVEVAKTLSYVWQKPLIGINHLEAHIYAGMLIGYSDVGAQNFEPLPNPFPLLALIVSGGHTELILMTDHRKYKSIGRTRDDAAGECFDKCAKTLGLAYPGGSAISGLAEKGDPDKYNLPRPMINSSDFNFSFSGLKTAVLYLKRDLEKKKKISSKQLSDLCASTEQAIVDVLIAKTLKAVEKFKPKSIVVSGGVAANQRLRKQLQKAIKLSQSQTILQLCPLSLCGDNAIMIALAGYRHWLKKDFVSWKDIKVDPNEKLGI